MNILNEGHLDTSANNLTIVEMDPIAVRGVLPIDKYTEAVNAEQVAINKTLVSTSTTIAALGFTLSGASDALEAEPGTKKNLLIGGTAAFGLTAVGGLSIMARSISEMYKAKSTQKVLNTEAMANGFGANALKEEYKRRNPGCWQSFKNSSSCGIM